MTVNTEYAPSALSLSNASQIVRRIVPPEARSPLKSFHEKELNEGDEAERSAKRHPAERPQRIRLLTSMITPM